MSIPERSPHKRPAPVHCQQRTQSLRWPPAMADSRDEDDEDSRDDSTEHGQQPDGYSLWVCIRVCEGGVCHTEQAAVAVNLVEEVEQALRSGMSRHMAGKGRNTPRGEW